MALIVSPGQNEIEQMKALGLDIVAAPQADERRGAGRASSRIPNDPLRLVFLCAMWLTGFDVPSCSTIYLDKPMRNHTLMQTIARANRVFPGKHSGLIVDYANVFASLEKALAIYAKGQGGATPVRDKRAAGRGAATAVDAAAGVLPGPRRGPRRHRGVADRQPRAPGRIADAVDRLISPDPLRKEFLAHERWCHALYQAVKPDPAVAEFSGRVACLAVIGAARSGSAPARDRPTSRRS